jgi:uncharacterized membrane protein
MPYCSQCGNQVAEADAFCARCGAGQPRSGVAAHPISRDPFANISPRTAAILCYVPVLGWVACIVVLAAARFRQERAVRFHAFQGLYLFVAWLLNDNVLRRMFESVAHFPVHALISLALLVMSVFMMVKASRDEVYSLPLFGELAERSLAEH